MTNTASYKESVFAEIRKKRPNGVTTISDINGIEWALITHDWSKAHNSELYLKHSPEYCELLEIVNRYTDIKLDESQEELVQVCYENFFGGGYCKIESTFARRLSERLAEVGAKFKVTLEKWLRTDVELVRFENLEY